jgi:hypothetical protein
MQIIDLCPEYKISSTGRIFSLPKRCGGKGKGVFLKKTREIFGSIDRYGYKYVNIRTIFGKKKIKIHRLVALAFIPNTKNYPTVNHKDGNKLSNNVSNLEWATHSQQIKHSWEIGLRIFTINQLEAVRKNVVFASQSHIGKSPWNKKQ